MIKSFAVKNFTSFSEWMELDFSLNDKVPEEFHYGNKTANLLCLKGANASGKTNALKSLAFLADFISNGFVYPPDEELALETFYNNTKPSEFYIAFTIDDRLYEFELAATKKNICREILKENGNTVVSRDDDTITAASLFKGEKLYVRHNTSVISSSYQYPHLQKYVEKIYQFFKNIIFNVSVIGFTQYPDAIFSRSKISDISEKYFKNEEIFNRTKHYLKVFDIGIADIKIETKHDIRTNKLYYYPVFIHSADNKEYNLTDMQESSGTRALFHHLLLYFSVLESGGVLILDEFDVNLHPDILPHLIGFFTDPKINIHNAQIIFTTHNNTIMELLGKYRTYLFQKEDNKSICYRLDEINNQLIRNDRPIVPLYEKGLLGGVPQIELNYEKKNILIH